MRKSDTIRLQHMLDAALDAVSFAAGRTRANLDTDRMLMRAVVNALEVVGEAAGQVSAEYRAQHPELPWHVMIAMRNRLIHAYADINHDVVWRTVTTDLPTLIVHLEEMLTSAMQDEREVSEDR